MCSFVAATLPVRRTKQVVGLAEKYAPDWIRNSFLTKAVLKRVIVLLLVTNPVRYDSPCSPGRRAPLTLAPMMPSPSSGSGRKLGFKNEHGSDWDDDSGDEDSKAGSTVNHAKRLKADANDGGGDGDGGGGGRPSANRGVPVDGGGGGVKSSTPTTYGKATHGVPPTLGSPVPLNTGSPQKAT